MGFSLDNVICSECGTIMHTSGRFIECDECGNIVEITNELLIASIKQEYPDAIITETDDKIIVDIQITLPKPVEKIYISGVVKP